MSGCQVRTPCSSAFFLLYSHADRQMFVKGRKMRDSRTHQPLTYDVRLPDEAQADVLRLLDASKVVINTVLTMLWPYLDAFGSERASPAWKQVGKSIRSPFPHGDRQWRG